MEQRHDIGRLEKTIQTVRERLTEVAQDDEFLELIKIIHQPGWTTPAEYLFVNTIVQTLEQHIDIIGRLKGDLLTGSRQVVGERTAV
jgi:hypothetical protein